MKDTLLEYFTIARRVLELTQLEIADSFMARIAEMPENEIHAQAHNYIRSRLGCKDEDLGIEAVSIECGVGKIYYMERVTYL